MDLRHNWVHIYYPILLSYNFFVDTCIRSCREIKRIFIYDHIQIFVNVSKFCCNVMQFLYFVNNLTSPHQCTSNIFCIDLKILLEFFFNLSSPLAYFPGFEAAVWHAGLKNGLLGRSLNKPCNADLRNHGLSRDGGRFCGNSFASIDVWHRGCNGSWGILGIR